MRGQKGGELHAMYKHGMKGTRFYNIWTGMKSRCYKEYDTSYRLYGEKGVTVCDEWHDFINFMNDMYESYVNHVEKYGEKETTLDRKDSSLGYSKDNCKWATLSEQNENRSNSGMKFKAISPSGEEYITTNYSKFAKEHSLLKGSIAMCLKGKCKQHRGWRFEYVKE